MTSQDIEQLVGELAEHRALLDVARVEARQRARLAALDAGARQCEKPVGGPVTGNGSPVAGSTMGDTLRKSDSRSR